MPTVRTLVTFNGTDGSGPEGDLIEDSAGNLFGTTAGGGANQDGTVFEIPYTANGYGTLTTLVSFNNSFIGYGPTAGLIADSAGDLFGTTFGGGANNAGSVFEIAKTASGYASTPTILASFNFGAAATTTGDAPRAGLITDAAGDLFGTTSGGGASGDGAVFEIPKTAGGYGTLTLLASFNFGTTGDYPDAGLTTDAAGDLFGTTQQGGPGGYGTVFEIASLGGGLYANTPTTLVSFTFNGSTGKTPDAGLITDSAGDLFGTTFSGGANGSGMVFEIAKTAGGYASTPTVLVSFNGTTGYEPMAGVIMDAAGDLFGTTAIGGPNGAGTVFEIAKTSTGYASTPIIVTGSISFADVGSGLIADSAGDLFGPAAGGGYGTVFEITGSGFQVTCYRQGTMIATPEGERAVELLAVGDLVQAECAGLVPVKWIGYRRINCTRHPDPRRVWPVRIVAGAFGNELPRRDLWLSPEHAVFVDDVLIPIKRLINGATIAQIPVDNVTYYHIELDRHDILLAEGLPAESYLDTGDRSKFANGGAAIVMHPDFSARMWEMKGCAPLVVYGHELKTVCQRLNERARLVCQKARTGSGTRREHAAMAQTTSARRLRRS
jgi:uncharacterized repeat protein (TIGR03803 family)